jgi:Short C-terminal domain
MEVVVEATPEQCVAALWEYFVHGEWPHKGQVTRGANGIFFAEEYTFMRNPLFRDIEKGYVRVSAVAEGEGRTRLYVIAKDRRYARTLERWMKEELPAQAASMELSPNAAQDSAASDIPDQIKKLAKLRDSGAITEEEFERKKAELLDRM